MASSERTAVCVQGLGFVGSAMCVALADARDGSGQPCFDVCGLDLDSPGGRARIRALGAGELPFRTTDPRLVAAARRAVQVGNLRATATDDALAAAAVIVVDVGFEPADDAAAFERSLAAFRGAIESVGRHMREDALVVVQTTVPPGTCDGVVAPLLRLERERRGLSSPLRLCHSYERVMPGPDYLHSLVSQHRCYAGIDDESAQACDAFLRRFVDAKRFPPTRLSSLLASETAKLLENSYRATNIAFVDEWGRFAEALGIDLFEVIDAIRLRPTHQNLRQPGFGVGGYCLTKDPLFAGLGARELLQRPDLRFPFSERAVEVNRRMPLVALDAVQSALGGELAGTRLLLLGASYRPGVADSRASPSLVFVAEARRRGAQVQVHDPLLRDDPAFGDALLRELPQPVAHEALVFAVAHPEYAQLDPGALLGAGRPLIFDANRVLSRERLKRFARLGCRVEAIGRGRVEP